MAWLYNGLKAIIQCVAVHLYSLYGQSCTWPKCWIIFRSLLLNKAIGPLKDLIYTWLRQCFVCYDWLDTSRSTLPTAVVQLSGRSDLCSWMDGSLLTLFKLKQMLRVILACQWLTLSLLPSATYTGSPRGKNDRHIHNAAAVLFSVARGKNTLDMDSSWIACVDICGILSAVCRILEPKKLESLVSK